MATIGAEGGNPEGRGGDGDDDGARGGQGGGDGDQHAWCGDGRRNGSPSWRGSVVRREECAMVPIPLLTSGIWLVIFVNF